MDGLQEAGAAGFAGDSVATPIDDGRWAVVVSPRWGVLGGAANGGYLTALVLRAVTTQLPTHPDPATVTSHYLRPPAPGPAEVRVEVLAVGRRFSRVRASLWQDGEHCVEVLCATTDLALHDGPTHVVASPPDLPVRTACHDPAPDEAGPVPPIRERLDLRVPPGGSPWTMGDPEDATGRGEVTAWVRWAGAEPMTTLGLLVLCDAMPPAVFDLDGPIGWVPTVELTVQVRSRPVPGWLRVVFRTRAVTNGLLEEDGEVWDADDNLVALSRQLALAPRPA
jgi:acyl-coenzyme A thioesterase PaaI-like protein